MIEQCEAQLRTNLTSDRVVAKLRRRASNIGESSREYSKGLASGFVTENFLLRTFKPLPSALLARFSKASSVP